MRKLIMLGIVIMLTACASNMKNDFGNSQEKLNSWAGRATFQQLCDGLFEYKEDGHVVKRLLIEFNRRNVSYMNCPQYRPS